jgi:hypothetical protein
MAVSEPVDGLVGDASRLARLLARQARGEGGEDRGVSLTSRAFVLACDGAEVREGFALALREGAHGDSWLGDGEHPESPHGGGLWGASHAVQEKREERGDCDEEDDDCGDRL